MNLPASRRPIRFGDMYATVIGLVLLPWVFFVPGVATILTGEATWFSLVLIAIGLPGIVAEIWYLQLPVCEGAAERPSD